MASEASHNDQRPTTEQAGVVERAQWLRAAILGANDGLLSTTALMLGVGAATPADHDRRRSVIFSGLAGAVAGACSMAVGEFVSISTQRDIEKQLLVQTPKHLQEHSRLSNISTPGRSPVMRVIVEDQAGGDGGGELSGSSQVVVLPNPLKAAAASGLAFLSGAAVPLALGAAVAADDRSSSVARIAVIVVAATAALAAFGGAGARLGRSPAVKVSAVRVVVGGWLAMAFTYALLKPLDTY